MAYFKHTPLRSTDQIRLLTLLPGQHTDTPTIKLSTASIDTVKHFAALSYCWGPSDSPRLPITCDGRRLDVRENLFCALVTLRLRGEPRVLWIDAICIDQDDDGEKSTQVPMMDRIYRRASEVLIWLGPMDRAARVVFDVAGRCVPSTKPGGLGRSRCVRELWAQGVRHGIAIRQTLERILSSAWFTRVWVVQELALSGERASIVVSDSVQLPWAQFIIFLREIDYRGYKYASHKLILAMERMRTQLVLVDYDARRFPTLLELLIRFQDFRASKPQDKVYALMSIARPDQAKRMIPIDYSLDPDEVFRLTTIAYVKTDLQILTVPMETFSNSHGRLADSPSWVLNWSKLSENESTSQRAVTQPLIELFGGNILKSGHPDHAPDAATPATIDGARLKLQGAVFDRIEEVSGSADPDEYGHINVPEISPNDWRTRRWWQFQRVTFTVFNELHKIACAATTSGQCSAGADPADLLGHVVLRRFQSEDDRISQRAFQKWHGQLEILRRMQDMCGSSNVKTRPVRFWTIWMICGILSMPHLLSNFLDPEALREHQLMVYRYVQGVARRRIFRTSRGLLGSGPRNTMVGDSIILCAGVPAPVVARASAESFLLVGDAYIRGLHEQSVIEGHLATGLADIVFV